MKLMPGKIPLIKLPLIAVLAFTACAPTTLPPEQGVRRAAALHLKQAAAQSLTAEQRAVLYLDSAKEASALLGEPTFRAWRLYLAGTSGNFRNKGIHVYRLYCEAV